MKCIIEDVQTIKMLVEDMIDIVSLSIVANNKDIEHLTEESLEAITNIENELASCLKYDFKQEDLKQIELSLAIANEHFNAFEEALKVKIHESYQKFAVLDEEVIVEMNKQKRKRYARNLAKLFCEIVEQRSILTGRTMNLFKSI